MPHETATHYEAHTRYNRQGHTVDLTDTGLETAIERARKEDPPGEVGQCLDDRPGVYIVRSRSAQLAGQIAYWRVVLDPWDGRLGGAHNCPARAEHPELRINCRHIALATDRWRQEHDPFLRRLKDEESKGKQMSESTALATVDTPQRGMVTYLPTEQDVASVMALATTLKETRGAAIPYHLDTVAKVAAVIIAGREAGFPAMSALSNFYVVNGATAPRAQAMNAMLAKAGGFITYAEMTAERCTATLTLSGRPPLTLTYTIEQAKKAGLVKSQVKQSYKDGKAVSEPRETSPWILFPEDMLVAKCVTRLCRRAAPHIINAVEGSQVRVIDIIEQAPSVYGARQDSILAEDYERPALEDHEEADFTDDTHLAEPPASSRGFSARDHADHARHSATDDSQAVGDRGTGTADGVRAEPVAPSPDATTGEWSDTLYGAATTEQLDRLWKERTEARMPKGIGALINLYGLTREEVEMTPLRAFLEPPANPDQPELLGGKA